MHKSEYELEKFFRAHLPQSTCAFQHCQSFPPASRKRLQNRTSPKPYRKYTSWHVWESTPHSGGYYHTSVTYNSNGTVSSISGIPSYTSKYTFGVDGEGRPN